MARLRSQDANRPLQRAPVVASRGLRAAAGAARAEGDFWRQVERTGAGVADESFRMAAQQSRQRAAEDAENLVLARHQVEHELVIGGETIVHRDSTGVALPTLPKADSISIYDQVYREAAMTKYLASVETEASNSLGQFMAEHPHEPERFAAKANAYLQSLNESVDPVVRGRVTSTMTDKASQMFGTLQQRKAEETYQQAIDATAVQAEELRRDMRLLIANGNSPFIVDASGKLQFNPDMQSTVAQYLDKVRTGLRLAGLDNPEIFEAEVRNLSREMSLQSLVAQVPQGASPEAFRLSMAKIGQDLSTGKGRTVSVELDEDGKVIFVPGTVAEMFTKEERSEIAGLLAKTTAPYAELLDAKESYDRDLETEAINAEIIKALNTIEAGETPELARLRSKGNSTEGVLRATQAALSLEATHRERLTRESRDRVDTATVMAGTKVIDMAQTLVDNGMTELTSLVTEARNPDNAIGQRLKAVNQIAKFVRAHNATMKKASKHRVNMAQKMQDSRAGNAQETPSASEFATLDSHLVEAGLPGERGAYITMENDQFEAATDAAIEATAGYGAPVLYNDILTGLNSMDPDQRFRAVRLFSKLKASQHGGASLHKHMAANAYEAMVAAEVLMDTGHSPSDETNWQRVLDIYRPDGPKLKEFKQLPRDARDSIVKNVASVLEASPGLFGGPDVAVPRALREAMLETLAYKVHQVGGWSIAENMVKDWAESAIAHSGWQLSHTTAGTSSWDPTSETVHYTQRSPRHEFPLDLGTLDDERRFAEFLSPKLWLMMTRNLEGNQIAPGDVSGAGRAPWRLGREYRLLADTSDVRTDGRTNWTLMRIDNANQAHILVDENDSPIVLTHEMMDDWLTAFGKKDMDQVLREARRQAIEAQSMGPQP